MSFSISISLNCLFLLLFYFVATIINITSISPLVSKCEIKVLYVGENRNRSFITKEVAAGVMYIKREKESIYLFPYVYVKSVNTWFFETACDTVEIND